MMKNNSRIIHYFIMLFSCLTVIFSCQARQDNETQKLLQTLGDDNVQRALRDSAARKLGELKDPKTITPIIKIMKKASSKNDFLLSAATSQILVEIGKPALPPLVKIIKNKHASPSFRMNAAVTLGNMGEVALVPLIELLKDKDAVSRELSAMALRTITGKDFGPNYSRWQEYLKHGKNTKESADGQQFSNKAVKLLTKEVPLAEAHFLLIPESIRTSSDSKHVAYVAISFIGHKKKEFVMLDDKPSNQYDEILIDSLTFSPDGKLLAYIASDGVKRFVVVDGLENKRYDQYENIPDNTKPAFSPDGKSVAFIAWNKTKQVVAVNDRQIGEYDEILADSLHFSPDGKLLIFEARQGVRRVTVLHGTDGRELDSASEVTVSRDGKRLAYVNGGFLSAAVLVDGMRGKKYDIIAKGSLNFSLNGNRIAYIAGRSTKWFAVVDGVEGKEYDKIRAPGVIFSPNGEHIAYTAQRDGKWFVVMDGVEGKKYDGIGEPGLTFGAGGNLPTSEGDRYGEWSLVAHGMEVRDYTGIESSVVFSPDGNRVAYTARLGKKWFVVVDGVEGRAYKGIAPPGPTFSPDGKHVAYKAYGGGYWTFVVDGVETKGYPAIPPGSKLVFDSSQSLHAIATRRGLGFILVQVQIVLD
jgi:roadblock/LC7 domain-containing protein